MATEAQSGPIRNAVGELFRQYRPQGNGEDRIRDIEASPVPISVNEPPPLITHRDDTDAQSPRFWRKLVSSPPECKIAKGTALFAVRTLLLQVLGFKAHRADITFSDDPTLEEMFSLLERLGGPACWATAQKLAKVAD